MVVKNHVPSREHHLLAHGHAAAQTGIGPQLAIKGKGQAGRLLQAIVDQTVGRAAYLRLAETLTTFLARLRSSADTLDAPERQRVLRLLVKEIRHCIPVPPGPNGGASATNGDAATRSTEWYLLRSRSKGAPLQIFRHRNLARRAHASAFPRGQNRH